MEWVEVGHDKFNKNRERYLNDPKAFLMLSCDAEPAFFEEIPNYIELLNELIEWREENIDEKLDEKYRLIPFAMNGGGDMYCFLYENGADEPKVIMYTHDCYDNPEIIGRNFDEFLYIMMLSCVNYAVEEDDFTELESEQWKNNLDYLLPEYKKMITENTTERLADIYWAINFEEIEIFS